MFERWQQFLKDILKEQYMEPKQKKGAENGECKEKPDDSGSAEMHECRKEANYKWMTDQNIVDL